MYEYADVLEIASIHAFQARAPSNQTLFFSRTFFILFLRFNFVNIFNDLYIKSSRIPISNVISIENR